MKIKITVYKSTGKFYNSEIVEHKEDIPVWRVDYKEFIVKNLPAKLSDGYVVVEDVGDNQSFHNALYKMEDLL